MITKIEPNSNLAYNLLHEGTLALARAERNGIRVDLEYLDKMKVHLTRKIERLEGKLMDTKFYDNWKRTIGGKAPNIHSNAQLATYLYRVKKLEPVKTTESGQGSTDEEALLDLGIPELNTLIQIRKMKKTRDTYLEGFAREQVDGFLHPSFNLHLVTTFRSSSDKPNFQNIPKRDKELMRLTRKALYPRLGHQLLEVDFSGLEVCIAACYHQDPTMIKYIKDPKSDMHGDMAKQLFKVDGFDRKIPEHSYLRSAAKNGFVFPQFYGSYYKNCAIDLVNKWGQLPMGKWVYSQGVTFDKEEKRTLAKHLIGKGIHNFDDFVDHVKVIEEDFWGNRFPVYAKWKDKWHRQYQKQGFVNMFTGFTCQGVMGRNDVINYPIQGSAFHCLLWSFIRLDDYLTKQGYDSRIIGQIHDAIVLDVHPDELDELLAVIKDITTVQLPNHWDWISVPLSIDAEICDVDAPWSDKKEIKIP